MIKFFFYGVEVYKCVKRMRFIVWFLGKFVGYSGYEVLSG